MASHQPRKRFGQNFLHDPRVIDNIIRAIAPAPGEPLVEIGPGQGALTWALLEAAGELDVVELDRDLVAALRRLDKPGLRIHEADALRFDFTALRRDERPLRLVGNLPYNISTPLIFHLLDQASAIADMHFMLQKEVVDRMAAPPGDGTYGRLSVMVQYRCRVEPLFDIPPGAFRPAPKVVSTVVRLHPYREPPLRAADEDLFARIVSQAFGQRRKTLRNCLKSLVSAETIEAAGLAPHSRAETLSVADYVRLANAAKGE
ncbi:16S rRNA (adenine(1518)-N(6)/adenine(1519)-N(6))-dimethyltransferase RsmA [Alkalilimnicola sp. S0819]|uniref:16S rRNA (adenine(1518)-N(6)/adenine(1519)-N(6))- dimethyltransferase RsmA n=1 Tax=Alkalilimnicola sp. S0819 TaxID=2613922 RepID=UPI0012626B1C|nr:16S rRNA (adenine(1518)-N(6)/adenine(1519)-N(6))-dimethyltransferase RsmA [Alkalilimnicola sp. S0819]KAB7622916.1 16S rRNA (adenine(1518)-N(6)/adenine(1519)-N(6))-dimethyltransferase RsmA [Alkalilimnicola sp. S0819]MPQ17240.1 16S rRNA (adenine(1518)-N(6)/adenine(1519)-N(6))-dimethyltransferase RsmA [Alkalilimnicola sp. S0819]